MWPVLLVGGGAVAAIVVASTCCVRRKTQTSCAPAPASALHIELADQGQVLFAGTSRPRLKVQLWKTGPFEGKVSLDWNDQYVKVFPTEEGGEALTKGAELVNAPGSEQNKTCLYLEGRASGTSTLTLSPTQAGEGSPAPVSADATVSELTLEIRGRKTDLEPLTAVFPDWKASFTARPRLGGAELEDQGQFQWKMVQNAIGASYVGRGKEKNGRQDVTIQVKAQLGQCTFKAEYTLRKCTVRAEHTFSVRPLEIKNAPDGSDAKTIILKGQTRKYKAVSSAIEAEGKFSWSVPRSCTGDGLGTAELSLTGKEQDEKTGGSRLEVTYEVTLPDESVQSTKATLELTVVSLEIKDAGGKAEPKPTLFKDQSREFTAVLTPAVDGGTFTWKCEGGKATVQSEPKPGTVALTANSRDAKVGDSQLEATCELDAQRITARHPLTVVELQLKGEDGNAAPAAEIALGLWQKFKAVLLPAVEGAAFTWKRSGPAQDRITLGENGQALHSVKGQEVSAVEASKLGVECSLHGQKASVEHQLRVKVDSAFLCSGVEWKGNTEANWIALARCDHRGDGHRQRPNAVGAGKATVAATEPHHHGGICWKCSNPVDTAPSPALTLEVQHWVKPIGTSRAAVEAVKLWKEISEYKDVPSAQRGEGHDKYKPWLKNVSVDRFWELDHENKPRSKMLGVVVAYDGADEYVFRGCSGKLHNRLNKDDPGKVNDYWSPRACNRGEVQRTLGSFSRGELVYPHGPVVDIADTQFGMCAASAMLSHVLDLKSSGVLPNLRIDSMAEIWVGGKLGSRSDGQLQASCQYCRKYLGELLCEFGGGAPTSPFNVNLAPPPNRGLN